MREKIAAAPGGLALLCGLALLALCGCAGQMETTARQPAALRPTASIQSSGGESGGLRPKAEAGDCAAQYSLGKQLLAEGSYFTPSPEGVAWLEKAAAQGSTEARLALGYRYRAAYCQGPAARSDKCAQARGWFADAASSGDVEAMGALIAMLKGPPLAGPSQVDPSKAYFWSLVRLRQKPMPPSAWIEESTAIRAGLGKDQADDAERQASLWRPDAPAPQLSLSTDGR